MTLQQLINKLQKSIDDSVCDANTKVAIEIDTDTDFQTCWDFDVNSFSINKTNHVCINVDSVVKSK